MDRPYRVGVIGFAHMHVNNVLASFSRHPQVTLVAGADTVPAKPERREVPYSRGWNVKHAVRELGLPQTYAAPEEMLAREAFDLIICCAENAQHAAVTEQAAAAGAHVVVEKPMAASLAHAQRMVRACRAAGTSLLVNWPVMWDPIMHRVKSLIDQGVIGRVLQVKWRGGHMGPLGRGVSHPGVDETAVAMSGPDRGATWWHQQEMGGGAMLDYCCYGALLSRWYVGEQATAAVGLRANLDSAWGDAEDNAAMLVRFPQAMALIEASWTTRDHGVPSGPIVYGTEGTLVVEKHEGTSAVRLMRGDGESTDYADDGEIADVSDIAQATIDHLESGEPVHAWLDPEYNLEVMAILDAGLRAADSGTMALVDNGAWSLGTETH